MAHGHDHHPDDATSERRVFWAMLLTGSFMVAEAAGGVLSGSLALLADAGHMLTDSFALALAWFSFRIARKPADASRSYGYHRFQVLAAFLNGVTLIGIVGWIMFEAIQRLFEPVTVLGGMMLVIAALGLLVNVVTLALLRGGDHDNLNIRAAVLHVLGDLLGSVATIAAAVVILWTGWMPIDPLLSVLVSLLILRSAWRLVSQSGHILLEGTPEWLDVEQLRSDLTKAVPAVEDIHHVHAWSLTSKKPLLTLHANVCDGADHGEVLASIKRFLEQRFGIGHSTIQLEPGTCADQRAGDGVERKTRQERTPLSP